MRIKLGISTCPNDTYIFAPIINNYVKHELELKIILDDVEVLNNLAIQNKLDIVKVSYGVVDKVVDNYKILKAGGALGFGCGPIVVSKNHSTIDELKYKKIGIPGKNTSAFKIYKHFFSDMENTFIEMRFDEIMPAINKDEIDAGIVIHEGRFVYRSYGLKKIVDLGDLWEQKHQTPIPLGCILISKKIENLSKYFCDLIRDSINFSKNNYNNVFPFIKKYAQELDDEIIKKHIELFVNEYSLDVSKYVNVLSNFIGTKESIFAK
jgi:1,4-dihydroxy-6-naphthoate synthase